MLSVTASASKTLSEAEIEELIGDNPEPTVIYYSKKLSEAEIKELIGDNPEPTVICRGYYLAGPHRGKGVDSIAAYARRQLDARRIQQPRTWVEAGLKAERITENSLKPKKDPVDSEPLSIAQYTQLKLNGKNYREIARRFLKPIDK